MPSVDLIRVSRLLFELNLLGIEGTNDPKCLAKELWKFRVFRDEKRRRKVEFFWGKGWGVTPASPPQKRL